MTEHEFMAFQLLREREHFLYRRLKEIAETPEDSALNLRTIAALSIRRDYVRLMEDHIQRGFAMREDSPTAEEDRFAALLAAPQRREEAIG